MTPWLVPAKATSLSETYFLNRRDKPLIDCIKCEVTEERNGAYYLEMEYPTNGVHAEEIEIDKIIMAKPYEDATLLDAFRITTITATIDGRFNIYAEHISYQLNSIMIRPLSGHTNSPGIMWNHMNGNSVGMNPFVFTSDIRAETEIYYYKNKTPNTLRAMLGGADYCMTDVFGGELKWSQFGVQLLKSRGADNGVTIAYGKNLTGLDYEVNLDGYWNGVVAWYKNENYNNGYYINSDMQSEDDGMSYVRAIIVDASSEIDYIPLVSDLNLWAQNYLAKNYSPPKMTVKVDFVPLWHTKEYEAYKDLEFVHLCDTVHVEYPPLGVSVSAKVVKTVFDVLADRYTSIEIGTIEADLSDTVSDIIKELNKQDDKIIQQNISITLANNSYVSPFSTYGTEDISVPPGFSIISITLTNASSSNPVLLKRNTDSTKIFAYGKSAETIQATIIMAKGVQLI